MKDQGLLMRHERIKQVMNAHHAIKTLVLETRWATTDQGGERDGNCSRWGDRDGGDGPGDDEGTTNPVCVGEGDTNSTVVTSLSSVSNWARLSARYVARLISHLASHSESTVM